MMPLIYSYYYLESNQAISAAKELLNLYGNFNYYQC